MNLKKLFININNRTHLLLSIIISGFLFIYYIFSAKTVCFYIENKLQKPDLKVEVFFNQAKILDKKIIFSESIERYTKNNYQYRTNKSLKLYVKACELNLVDSVEFIDQGNYIFISFLSNNADVEIANQLKKNKKEHFFIIKDSLFYTELGDTISYPLKEKKYISIAFLKEPPIME